MCADDGGAWPRGRSVDGERVRDGSGILIKRPLRQPGHPGRCWQGEIGDLTEAGHHVVGSYDRSGMPHDQAKYGICLLSFRCGAPSDVQQEHGRAYVEPATPFLGESLHFNLLGREERGNGCLGVVGADTGKFDSPLRCFQTVCPTAGRCRDHVEDGDTVRHRGVEPLPDTFGVHRLGQSELAILRLTCHSRGSRTRVGDLGMRREPRRKSYGYLGPAQCTLKYASDIAMARESHAVALRVPHTQPLGLASVGERIGALKCGGQLCSFPQILTLPRGSTRCGSVVPRERSVLFSAYGAYRQLCAIALVEVQLFPVGVLFRHSHCSSHCDRS